MQAERLEELERACNGCAPRTVFVALTNGGVTRIDPNDILELIRSYRTLCWTKAASNHTNVRESLL